MPQISASRIPGQLATTAPRATPPSPSPSRAASLTVGARRLGIELLTVSQSSHQRVCAARFETTSSRTGMGHASATNATPSAIGCRWRSSSGDGGQPEPDQADGHRRQLRGWRRGDASQGLAPRRWQDNVVRDHASEVGAPRAAAPNATLCGLPAGRRPGRSRRRRGGSMAASGVDRD